jgi:hypothetical protein
MDDTTFSMSSNVIIFRVNLCPSPPAANQKRFQRGEMWRSPATRSANPSPSAKQGQQPANGVKTMLGDVGIPAGRCAEPRSFLHGWTTGIVQMWGNVGEYDKPATGPL